MKKTFLLWAVLIMAMACRLGSDDQIIPDLIDGVVPLPPNEDYGVLCFVELEDLIVANAPVFDTFASQDGGLSWKQYDLGPVGISGSGCTPSIVLQKELWVPPDGMVRYRFEVGLSIEVSDDQGSSWGLAYDLSEVLWEPAGTPDPEREIIVQPGPLDAMIDPHSGNLLLAMGHAGILVKLPSGEWRWAGAGPYTTTAIPPDPMPMDEDSIPDDMNLPTFKQIVPGFEIDTQNNYLDAMVFSSDGAQLATSGFKGGIKLFDFPEGELQHWLQWGAADRNDRVYGAVFSRDGETLITCGTNVDQKLRFWDVGSWELINQYEGYQTGALDTGCFENEQYFAIGFGPQANIFRLPEGKEVGFLETQLAKSSVARLHFIPDTKFLALGGTSGGVELWDFEQKEIVFTLQSDQQDDGRKNLYRHVLSLGYTPSRGVLMALQGDGKLTAWDISTGELDRGLALQVPHGWYINTAAFSEDGSLVAVGMHNGPLLVFDSSNGEMLSRQWITDGGTLQQLAFSTDSQWLAAGFTTGKVKLWQVESLIHQD